MDPVENLINVSMAGEIHDQSCGELLKSLIALNDENGKSIDETAISTAVEEHKECMLKYLQVISFDLETRVTDALQNRRNSDKAKINELANIAMELADAWKNDDSHMSTDKTDANLGLSGNYLLVYKAIQSFDSGEFGVGISRTELETRFSNIPRRELIEIIEFFNYEGICFSTIDGDHFMATDAE